MPAAAPRNGAGGAGRNNAAETGASRGVAETGWYRLINCGARVAYSTGAAR